jgi:hypothetical protein
VTIAGNVSPNTTVTWQPVEGANAYRVWWRGTTDPQWRYSRRVEGATQIELTSVVIDDWFFGVSAISADGFESPIVFPGPPGAFFRETPAPTAH